MVSSLGLSMMILLPSPPKMLLAASGGLIMSLPVSAKIVPLPSPVIRLSSFWDGNTEVAVISETHLIYKFPPIAFFSFHKHYVGVKQYQQDAVISIYLSKAALSLTSSNFLPSHKT